MSVFAVLGAVSGAAHSAIVGLATLLTPVTGGLATALAIVLFTAGVRLLISPLAHLQIRAERRRAALAPRLEELRNRYRNDPRKAAVETVALLRANGAGPFVSLLPGLAQAPFLLVMYRVALDAPAGMLFGVPLTAHLTAGLPVFAVLLAIAAMPAWRTSHRIARTASGSRSATGGPDLLPLLRLLPWLALVGVAWLPLAGALYLVTSTAWTAAEQAWLRRD